MAIHYLIDKLYWEENVNSWHNNKTDPNDDELADVIKKAIEIHNKKVTKTKQPDLLLSMNEFDSIESLKELISKGACGDHFIFHTHGFGGGMVIGGKQYAWNVLENEQRFKSLLDCQSKSLSLRVCRVSDEVAEKIKEIAGVENVYYNTGDDIKPLRSFDLTPTYVEGSLSEVIRYDYNPAQGGLKKTK